MIKIGVSPYVRLGWGRWDRWDYVKRSEREKNMNSLCNTENTTVLFLLAYWIPYQYNRSTMRYVYFVVKYKNNNFM